MSEFNVTLINRLEEIGRLATLIESFGERHQISAELIYAFNLSLDEVLTNVISYGFADAREHTIHVRFRLAGGELVARVADQGRPFNPLEVAPPKLDVPIEERPIGGLGIHIVREMMDRLDYRRVDECNVLTLTKRLR